MTEATTFIDHTTETAPEASRAALAGTTAKLGFLPSAMARMAESPTAVAAFGKIRSVWESSALSLVEREVVAMAASGTIGCEVCVAMHSGILRAVPEGQALAETFERHEPLADRRLEALRSFALAVIAQRGAVSDGELGAFLDAGFTREQALDVVVGVATYTLTGYANRLTRAPVDAALQERSGRSG